MRKMRWDMTDAHTKTVYINFRYLQTMRANDLSNFTFRRNGSGCYRVTYTTGRGDFYTANINDMTIIDNTLHADWARLSTIKHLAYLCRLLGRHYHASGTPFSR